MWLKFLILLIILLGPLPALGNQPVLGKGFPVVMALEELEAPSVEYHPILKRLKERTKLDLKHGLKVRIRKFRKRANGQRPKLHMKAPYFGGNLGLGFTLRY